MGLPRHLQRSVKLYVGPPNSGKTHAAFERLAQALDGAYLAPLRLLALEGRDRLVGRGVPCSLLTGEENVPADGARVVSSTIEMMGTGTLIERAIGSAFDDVLLGNDANNALKGGLGNDWIDGGKGTDTAVFDGFGSGSETLQVNVFNTIVELGGPI